MITMKKLTLLFAFLAAGATWLLGETIVVTSTSNQTQSITITVPYCADVMVHGAAYARPPAMSRETLRLVDFTALRVTAILK